MAQAELVAVTAGGGLRLAWRVLAPAGGGRGGGTPVAKLKPKLTMNEHKRIVNRKGRKALARRTFSVPSLKDRDGAAEAHPQGGADPRGPPRGGEAPRSRGQRGRGHAAGGLP